MDVGGSRSRRVARPPTDIVPCSAPACPSRVCPFVIKAEPADEPDTTKGLEMTGTPATSRALRWVVGLTSAAYFMVVLDALVVVTALPRMQSDLHVGVSSVQWTITAYGIAFAAGIITAAAVGDRFGRRLVFGSGLALFTLASAACALAPNMPELVIARTVQGLGAAAVLPLSLTILTTAFPPAKRGMIVGVYGGLAGLAVALGPILGGAITQAINWHWIFWINVPIGVTAVLLGRRFLPESHGPQERLDLRGVVLVTGGVVALVWALTRANAVGWSSAQSIGTLCAGALLLAAFVWWEQRASEPMVPLRLFASREFAVGNLTSFLMSGATFAAAFFLTQEFQLARGYSPLGTGLRLLPFFATPMFVSPVAGALSDRIGRRPIMIAGLSLQAIGFIWVAARGSLTTSWIELDIALLIAGVGISMALPTVPTAVLSAVAPQEMGKASGINFMAQRFGTVFAIAIASAVFSGNGHLGSPASVTAGFRPALWACAVFAVLAALTALGITPRRTATVQRVKAADLPIAA
jgi:EmrB/QacA subfamily drug resistance transporter